MAFGFCGKRLFMTRRSRCLLKGTNRKYGYIVLLPEIGEDLPEKNPLLKENGLPEFNAFTIERSIAAVGRQTVEFERCIKDVETKLGEKEKVDIIEDVLDPLEEADVPLETTWGIVKALYFGNQSLVPQKYYESVHNRMARARSCKLTSGPIYEACKTALESEDYHKMSDSDARTVAKLALEGRLNGLALSGKKKAAFDSAMTTLTSKRHEVASKLQATRNLFSHTITNVNTVRDFPEDYLKMIAVDTVDPTKGPWKITLEPCIADPFMELCPDRNLRWNVWQADVSRAGPDAENNYRTSGPIETIRDNLQTQAKILGYKSHSHMSMETKMASSLDNIYAVMDTLLQSARAAQEEEIRELTEFAKERGFEDTLLREWDMDYWARKHRRSVFNDKEETLRQYFPLDNVLKGLFSLTERLFNVKIQETRKTDVWHADVRFFDVVDLEESSEEPIASFYLDPYARRDIGLRMEKDAGWMVAMRNKSHLKGTKPLAALVFNFQPPSNEKPSLLSLNDVVLLFKKFGHALQHLLTKATRNEVAGLSNVEWDAVGISGNFMANWLYEASVIRQVSSHWESAEPLPEQIIQNLNNIRSHMAGYKLCKKLYLARFDLEMHELDEFWVPMMKRLWKMHFVIPQEELNSHVTTWDSIFVGNWDAAFYCDLWSEMVAADAYSAFQEIPAGEEQLEKEIAKRYRDTFLSLGGSCAASQVFRKFRGRDPSPNALLKNLGLTKRPKVLA